MMEMISKKPAKKILLFLLIVGNSLFSMATSYYVSSTGNDANSGLTTALPWKTLTKVNAATFKAGDQILFQRGNTFYGSITVKNSGIAGNPITYGAYGTGSNPVITGFTSVTAWTNLGSNIWESTSAVTSLSTCNMVTVKGVNTAMGRMPNMGYFTISSHSANTSITTSGLTGTPNWTGATAVIRKERWILQRATITSQSGGTISYKDEQYISEYAPRDGWGFFIQNDSRTLDVQNEWYYNPTTKRIRIYSTSQPLNIKIPTIENLFTCDTKNHITVNNITFNGANSLGLSVYMSDYFNISNCSIFNIGLEGITISSTNYSKITTNLIKHCNHSSIYSATNNTYEEILNNVIDSTGMIAGAGRAAYPPSAICSYGDFALIQFNQIDHSGYNGIKVEGATSTSEIRNNFINNSLLNRSDGGGIYTDGSHKSCIIDGNIVLNSYGETDGTSGDPLSIGIYLDLASTYVTISNNTVAHCRARGIFISRSSYNTITNNTTYDNGKGINIADYSGTGMTHNNKMTGNIFVAKTNNQGTGTFNSITNNIPTFLSTSNNNYFARPIGNAESILVNQPDSWSGGNDTKTLAQWQLFSGKDANSFPSPQTITSVDDLQFEYNATKTVKTISLSQPMMDVKGIKYASTVTLQPYTSIVLMKDYKAAKSSTEYKSICDGLSYNGWTTTGKYIRTLVAKSGIDSIVTTYLTVNPKYAIQENVTINSGEYYQGWNSSGTYTRALNSISGCDSVVTTYLTVSAIKVGETMTQTIALKKGNNMISTYVQPANPDVSLVTQTTRNSGDLIKMQNESGNSYENWGTLGGWINNLGSLQITEGYKIMVANDCNIQITGQQISLPLNISLNVGWNIISFPRTDILDAKMIIQSLIDQNALVKVQDEIGNSIEDWGTFGGWKNGIGNFLPGKAYRVKVSKSAVLTIQNIYPKSVAIPVYAEQTKHFSSVAEGNGYDHMNINLVGLNESGLSSGDELAAFDGTICVGTLQITDQHLMEGSASLIASCSTGNLQKDGFNEGSSIQLQVWNKISGEQAAIQFSILRGSPSYLKNATVLGNLKSLTTSVTNFVHVAQNEVYPNPSQGRFTVRFSDLPVSGSRIDVLDLSGRKIASRLITGISEEFDLFGQASGLYLVKSILGVKENIDKLIIQY